MQTTTRVSPQIARRNADRINSGLVWKVAGVAETLWLRYLVGVEPGLRTGWFEPHESTGSAKK